MAVNPFTPTFGTSPPALVGRDDIIARWREAAASRAGHPDRHLLLTGSRGSGKTVALNAIEDAAIEIGWHVISLDATPGVPDRIRDASQQVSDYLSGPEPANQISSLRILGFSIGRERIDRPEPEVDLRGALTNAADLVVEGSGILITIDEIHDCLPAEVQQIGNVIQHVANRQERPVSLVGAGLPAGVLNMLDTSGTTFMHRITRVELDRLNRAQTIEGMRRPIREAGGRAPLEGELIEVAAAIKGFPFALQLAGFGMWNAAQDPAKGFSTEEIAEGIASIESQLAQKLFEPSWKGLSNMDRLFVVAMTVAEDPATVVELKRLLDRSSSWVGNYRNRLMAEGWIEPGVQRGTLRLVQPSASEWVANRPDYHDLVDALKD